MEKVLRRWTARRKAGLVLTLTRGEKKRVDACREYDLKLSEVEEWSAPPLKARERGLKMNADDEQGQHERELKELRAKVGELVPELDARKKCQALTDPTETAS